MALLEKVYRECNDGPDRQRTGYEGSRREKVYLEGNGNHEQRRLSFYGPDREKSSCQEKVDSEGNNKPDRQRPCSEGSHRENVYTECNGKLGPGWRLSFEGPHMEKV
ncbi:hypothetical protein BTVI_68776 [Pitangus sulphuratus]|nr:hypothetical protein BTVI_68776 [Pitangus sulphuratus]